MSTIRVTATVSYEYDTVDGLVSTPDEALEDVQSMLDGGRVFSSQFNFTVEELPGTSRPTARCRHCDREITTDSDGRWVDPEATGDDSVWRETCDAHDTFTAEHEPPEIKEAT